MILPHGGLEGDHPALRSGPEIEEPPALGEAGSRLSDYTILEPIGSGLRGTVYRARSGAARAVALKVFNRGVAIDAAVLHRFSPAAPDRISHPSLVTVEEVGQAEGALFCAMALLRGDSLETVLAEGRGSTRRPPHLSLLAPGPDGRPREGAIRHAVALLLEVAEGLERAHREGLVHGRLGPRNLIFSPSGRLVVTDFGAERARGGARRLGNGVSHDLATLTYRAPEEIEISEEGVDCRADVYALGAILYELLTGSPPYGGREPQRVREAIAEGSFVAPTGLEPRVSPEAEAVVLRAMALDPAERYGSAGPLAEDLRRLLLLEATAAGSALLAAPADGAAPPLAKPALEEREAGPEPPRYTRPRGPEVLVESPEWPLPAPEQDPAHQEHPERHRAARKPIRRLPAAVAALLVLSTVAGWIWLTLFLHDGGERSRARAETFSSGYRHLERAVLALVSEDERAAGGEVAETRRLGIEDRELAAIESALGRRGEDPLLVDLSHPRAAVRREAVAAIAREAESGERPAADLTLLEGSLGDGDPEVRAAAVRALARGGSSGPLLAAYPIGEPLEPLWIDGPTLLALVESLAEIGDPSARRVLLSFSLEDFARLDRADPDLLEPVPAGPNLRVALPSGPPGGFAAAWVRARARLQDQEILRLAKSLLLGEKSLRPLAGEIVEGLAALKAPESIPALWEMAVAFPLEEGTRVVAALRGLGAAEPLLELARAPVPDPLRALAARAAGEAARQGRSSEIAAAGEEILGLLAGDPSPEVRRAALEASSGLGERAAAGALRIALLDPALEEETLERLASRPPAEALPPLLDLLRTGDGRHRLLASRAIGAAGDPAALTPLALLLFEDDQLLREEALKAMGEIKAGRALELAAGILPPGGALLRELALEAARCPLESGESPALRLLAIREALDLGGADEPPQTLRQARRALLREGLPGSAGERQLFLPPRAARLSER